MSSSTDQNAPTFVWSRADIAAADAAGDAISAHLTRYAPRVAQMLSRDDLSDLAAVAVRAARAVYDERDFNGRVTRSVLAEVGAERGRQDERWGEQNHPQADPVILARLGTGGPGSSRSEVAQRLAEQYEVPGAARAKFICENERPTTWAGIALEEFAEVLDAAVYDWPTQRTEYLQLAAVLVGAVEAGDRAKARAAGATGEGAQR